MKEAGEVRASDVVKFTSSINDAVEVLLDDLATISPKLRAASDKRIISLVRSISDDVIKSFIKNLGYSPYTVHEIHAKAGTLAEAFLPNSTEAFMPLKSLASVDFQRALGKAVREVGTSDEQLLARELGDKVGKVMMELEGVIADIEEIAARTPDHRAEKALQMVFEAYEKIFNADERLNAITQNRD